VDLAAVGRTTLRFWGAMLKRADADLTAARPSGLKDQGHGHVKYEALVKDPVGTVRNLYRSFGWAFSKVRIPPPPRVSP
jgi:hypothetical protein